jgi:hypothetical protein
MKPIGVCSLLIRPWVRELPGISLCGRFYSKRTIEWADVLATCYKIEREMNKDLNLNQGKTVKSKPLFQKKSVIHLDRLYREYEKMIAEVKADPEFLISPHEYIERWAMKRRDSAVLKLPEDAVLSYFKRSYLGLITENLDIVLLGYRLDEISSEEIKKYF